MTKWADPDAGVLHRRNLKLVYTQWKIDQNKETFGPIGALGTPQTMIFEEDC